MRKGPPTWALIAVAFLVLALIPTTIFIVGDPKDGRSSDVVAATPVTPLPPVTPPSDADVTMLDIWASSTANGSYDIPARSWVMTDFPVTQPYIRSVEVAASPMEFGGDSHGISMVTLRVLNAHGVEVDSGDAAISGYRAKYVFSHSVDVRPYLGGRLYLQMRNISSAAIHAYFSPNDRDTSVTSYVPCAASNPVLCPNPEARDLSARVVGRAAPWS